MIQQFWFTIYRWLIFPLIYISFIILSQFNAKIKKGIKDRENLFKNLEEFRGNIGSDKKVILFHCVSMGELEQAKPLAKKIKAEFPGIKIIVSFLSPSGYDNFKKLDYFDFKTYLPSDKMKNAKEFFAILKPSMWIIVKHDIWPNHLRICSECNIPIILIDANMPKTSKRILPVVRTFFKAFYKNISLILPVSENDAKRFATVYPYHENIILAGDTRYDQVFIRSQIAKDKDVGYLSFYKDKKVFLCGSVWKEDLQNILPAVLKLINNFNNLYIIIVPHEPEFEQLNYLENELTKLNLPFNKYAELNGEPSERILIIDTIGILASLYKYAYVSYVGGSFTTGVHNVMEPAIFENPVLFGPKHNNSFEALEMVKKGGAFPINNSKDVYNVISELLSNSEKQKKSGKTASSIVVENLGATDKIMDYIRKYIENF